MKTTSSMIATAGMSVLLALPALAIDPPKDESPPPALRNRIIESVKTPYIGLVTNQIPEALSSHLGTRNGVIITDVLPNGPAATAGLGRHDIITRINSEEVQSPDDVRRIVRARKPGDVLQLETIHQGQPRQVEVKISERAARLADQPAAPFRRFDLGRMPDEFEKRIREMIEGSIGEFDLNGLQGNLRQLDMDALAQQLRMLPSQGFGDDLQNMMREMSERLSPDPSAEPQAEAPDTMRLQPGSTVRILDNEGSLEISSRNGTRQLIARDTANQEIWSGPWNTDEDKMAAPESIRKRVEKLKLDSALDGDSLQLQLRPTR